MQKPNVTITKQGYKCLLCGHTWVPRVGNPQECPNCKRRDWNKEREK